MGNRMFQARSDTFHFCSQLIGQNSSHSHTHSQEGRERKCSHTVCLKERRAVLVRQHSNNIHQQCLDTFFPTYSTLVTSMDPWRVSSFSVCRWLCSINNGHIKLLSCFAQILFLFRLTCKFLKELYDNLPRWLELWFYQFLLAIMFLYFEGDMIRSNLLLCRLALYPYLYQER